MPDVEARGELGLGGGVDGAPRGGCHRGARRRPRRRSVAIARNAARRMRKRRAASNESAASKVDALSDVAWWSRRPRPRAAAVDAFGRSRRGRRAILRRSHRRSRVADTSRAHRKNSRHEPRPGLPPPRPRPGSRRVRQVDGRRGFARREPRSSSTCRCTPTAPSAPDAAGKAALQPKSTAAAVTSTSCRSRAAIGVGGHFTGDLPGAVRGGAARAARRGAVAAPRTPEREVARMKPDGQPARC